MEVTLAGIVTLVNDEQVENALALIAVTPPGIDSAPTGDDELPVIVIVLGDQRVFVNCRQLGIQIA
jgi:hypothetical protein